MKILHLADGPRNIRAERAALGAKTVGIKDHFVTGNTNVDIIKKSIFKKKRYIDISAKNYLLLDLKNLEKKIQTFIDEIDPDVIHAHNIYLAKIAKNIGLPYVYDDHELWSEKIRCYKRKSIRGNAALIAQRALYPSVQREIGKDTSIIVPSKGILNFYKNKYKTNDVFFYPNMPMLEEVANLKLKEQRTNELITAAIGVSTKSTSRHRDIDGFVDLWKINNDIGKILIIGQNDLESSGNIISTGHVSHTDCFIESSIGHIGIIPFKQYKRYHKFSGANKAYLYIHSGLGLITPNTQIEFTDVIKEVGLGYQFNDYNDLVDYLRKNKEKIISADREEIIKIAREKYILDNFANNLKLAYEKAIEINDKKK